MEAAEGMLGGLKSIVPMSNEATLDVSMRPSCIFCLRYFTFTW